MPPETHATTAQKPAKPRKVPQRTPRTPEEVCFAACNNVLRKADPKIRTKVMASLTALYASS